MEAWRKRLNSKRRKVLKTCGKYSRKTKPRISTLELDIQVNTRKNTVIVVIFQLYCRVIIKPNDNKLAENALYTYENDIVTN